MIALFDVRTGYLYAQCWDPGTDRDMAFIRDGTELVSYSYSGTMKIYNIANLAAKHRNATHGYELILRGIRDGWVIDPDDELLFWIPLEHRQVLCLPRGETVGAQPTKVDLATFTYGSKWTECVDKKWLKELEEREQGTGRLLE